MTDIFDPADDGGYYHDSDADFSDNPEAAENDGDQTIGDSDAATIAPDETGDAGTFEVADADCDLADGGDCGCGCGCDYSCYQCEDYGC